MVNKYIVKEKISINDFLLKNHLSKTFINKLFANNAISNNNIIIKNNHMFNKGDIFYINYSLLEDNSSINTDCECLDIKSILYEDDDIICVDKPYNLLVHSDGITNNTLLNYTCKYLKEKYDDSFLRCLHRIDVDTSGVCVFCKNIFSYQYLSYALENGNIYKEYLAYCKGALYVNKTIDLYIGKDRHNSKKYIAFANKKANSTTLIEPIKVLKDKTLVKCVIKTGKPHQIRVTLKYLNHPIVGDKLYNDDNKDIMYLLSNKIEFDLFGKNLCISSKKRIDNL